MEEELDIDHSPAINPLPSDFVGPTWIQFDEDISDFMAKDRSGEWKAMDDADTKDDTDDEDYRPEDEEQSNEEDGDDDEGSSDGLEELPERGTSWESHRPPTMKDVRECLADLNAMLKPPRPKGGGYMQCHLPLLLRMRIEWIVSFLHVYTDDGSKYGKGTNSSRWTASSLHAAHAHQSTLRCAKNLRKWAKALIIDREALPCSRNGTARNCRIDDEDVAAEIATHLQSLGLWIRALDIVHYTTNPEVQARLKIKKTVSLATAHHWLAKMGYWWTKKPSGQYVDGHECDDVVHYRLLAGLG
jgi:hypothetical protein